jgi:hypothetical protein
MAGAAAALAFGVLGFLFVIVFVVATVVLTPTAAIAALLVATAALFDWLRKRRARVLAAIPPVDDPLRATLRGERLYTEEGPLELAAPLVRWRASWLDRLRRRAELEVHGVVVRQQTAGGYREAGRLILAPPAGATVIHAFVGRRHEHERRLAEVVVTRSLVRFVVILTVGAITCGALVIALAASVDFGMG